MLKKSEVNKILAIGVISAHSFQYFEHNDEPLDNEQLLLFCQGMAEALVLIDLGYSCTDDELNAEIAAMTNSEECPRDVKAAMFARILLKATYHLNNNEKIDKMLEMANIKRKELAKEREGKS